MATLDVLVVGAGFSGLYLLKRLRDEGFSVQVLEAGDGIGGTWYHNRYPGLRCDVESMTYSYSFDDDIQREWTWTHRYARQGEILAYVDHVADRLDLRRDIRLNERVVAATWREGTATWEVRTEAGGVYEARFCVMATGCLSVPNLPEIPGLEAFAGDRYHTAAWPKEGVDLSGKRVGVIGTGSSGVQMIPVIAAEVAHLTVFQRTPNWAVPAWNAPLTPEEVADWKATFPERRARARTTSDGDIWDEPTQSALEVTDEEREAAFERGWRCGSFGFLATFTDILSDERANALAAEFFRRKLRARIDDPARADVLIPTNYVGTKRLCVDTDYYETYNRPNVDIVDLRRTPLEAITERGIRTSDGERELDVIIFATGFDAMTGALVRAGITGRDGRSLAEDWSGGPHCYLGLAMAGYPNLLTVTGPHSPSVFTNVMSALEQHVEWISDLLVDLRRQGARTVEATEEAERWWMEQAAEAAPAICLRHPRTARRWPLSGRRPAAKCRPRALPCGLPG